MIIEVKCQKNTSSGWIQNYRPTWKTEWWTTIRY